MSVKRLIPFILMTALFAGTAFAQKAPQPGTHITVSKTTTAQDPLGGMFQTIQAAVNAAQPGQVIEILDESVYQEQVTIEGRETHPWGNSVRGGKNDITIRYVPASSSVTARPTIRYQDRTNVSPTTCAQAQDSTKMDHDVGTSGNFETNGALRIIRASRIIIEALIIDGGGKNPFGYDNVWQNRGCPGTGTCCSAGYDNAGNCQAAATAPCPFFYGNAAIAVAVSNGVQIRDCEIKNAHYGIAVKDRNTGGVFGNPNPADNDFTVPISGFGKTGNHVIEYNKIYDNNAGIFFESLWDLGSTVRYNLIYNNRYPNENLPSGPGDEGDKRGAGGIVFKDNYLSPVAIYNNTFHLNVMHLVGQWQVGYQHLVFNNIFGPSQPDGQGTDWMNILRKFPNRMWHNAFSDQQYQYASRENGLVTTNQNRQIAVNTTMFASITPGNANYMVPNWTSATTLRGGGWPASNILNAAGTGPADIGAIQQAGKRPCDGVQQTSRVRIAPYSVVILSGTQATASIVVTQEIGTVRDLAIKYIRWIAPVPDNGCPAPGTRNAQGVCSGGASFGSKGDIVASGSVRTVGGTLPTLSIGSNRVPFTISGTIPQYGFFEIVLEGKDGNGNTVTSDVGFLPYRQLDYELDIKVYASATSTTPLTTVKAGEEYIMRVRAMDRRSGTPTPFTQISNSVPLEVVYQLLSSASANIYKSVSPWPNNNTLIEDIMTSNSTDHTVYFTTAGEEIISGAGVWAGPSGRLSFLGDLVLTVRPGAPEKVTFIDPIPKSQIPAGTPPPGINGDYPVTVQVQDRFGNATDSTVAVSIAVTPETDTVGRVEPDSGTTDGATGNVLFTASVNNGKPGDIFDMVASIRTAGGGTAADTGSLRVVRAAESFMILYSNPAGNASADLLAAFMNPDAINENIPNKAQVWIKVVRSANDGSGVNTDKNGYVCVTADTPDLLMSATRDGEPVSGSILLPITNGGATLWVTS
jgi:hypothetical protein